MKELSKELTKEFGKGFSVSNLQFMRRFYQSYQIQQTVSVKLSWSHYCELLTISDPDKRSFYEKETINSGWSIRELKRQISTSLYERLLLSEGKTNKENGHLPTTHKKGGKNMNLPKDAVMLLSVVNTQLRDNYATLAEMAAAYMTDATEIIAKLDAINYHYDEKQNQFI